MSRSRIVAAAACAVVGLAVANSARAALVVVDFNDLAAGNLAGQAGGTGMSSTAWAGATPPTSTAIPQVVSGDLTAPAATHYTLAQSAGTPRSIQTTATNSSSGTGQDTRPLAGTLTGTVWFSFLANPTDANARAGISFNTSGGSASGARMDFTQNGGLYCSYGAGGNVGPAQAVGVTHLIVGEVIINESATPGNDHLRLWVDPDVQNLSESTTAGRVFDSAASDWVGDGITSLAVQSYTGGTTAGGAVDAIRISNDPNAQSAVTGFAAVPEPTAVGLTAAAASLLVRRNRRRRR